VLRITAYIAWSLANIGYEGAAVDRAKQCLGGQAGGFDGRAGAGGVHASLFGGP